MSGGREGARTLEVMKKKDGGLASPIQLPSGGVGRGGKGWKSWEGRVGREGLGGEGWEGDGAGAEVERNGSWETVS